MADVRDDDLASGETLPAAPSANPPDRPTGLLGSTLGRYRLERELGAGGMGVVYAAFDPDLERRIALKVLRVAAPTAEAKDRLLREARAMARLAHPNVITVHEVGTAAGRDFVAMELIHGESLAEWLGTARPPAAIFHAFIAAGRGLAAAHAAAMVHRDFKPHNVLRGRDGRIVVTDFGLARDAQAAPADALATTLAAGTQAIATHPSALAGLTVTGSLLGTPAYMAPEQWNHGAVTPATDQFAYCVALWEALSGERPYRGQTFQALQAEVERGPDALDASRIPRRVRPILRRGLAPAPDRRWPSMNALIGALERTQRRRGLAFALGGAAIAAAGALILARTGAPAPPLCAAPAHDPQAVWSPAIAADLRAKTSDAHAAVLEAAYQAWQTARGQACRAAPQLQPAQLQCLDGVLARFDAVRQAFARVPGAAAEEIQAQLIVPAICQRPIAAEVPRLTLAPSPEVIAAYELYGRAETDHKPGDTELAALLGKPNLDPCARVIAALAFELASEDVLRTQALMADTVSTVDQCGDERLRADLLIRAAPHQYEHPVIGRNGQKALERAQAAAQRVRQPDVDAALAVELGVAARQRDSWDEAFRLFDTAIAENAARGLPIRQVRAAIVRNRARLIRRLPTDLEAISGDVAYWRPIAAAGHRPDLVTELDWQAAGAQFWLGDVPRGHAALMQLLTTVPSAKLPGAREIHGEVVDLRGHPVAGASVATAPNLAADSIGIGVPLGVVESTLRLAITDDRGRFVITSATASGAIAAQLGDRRSMSAAIADHVRLVLEPTRSVSGTVALGAVPYTRVVVACDAEAEVTGRFHTIAPVARDGSFTVAGASTRAIRVGVATTGTVDPTERVEYQTAPAAPTPITDLRLTVTSSNRVVDVILHSDMSTALDGAAVLLLSGKPQIKNLPEILRLRATSTQTAFARRPRDDEPAAVRAKLRRGDLVAHVERVGLGDLTVCAFGYPGDLNDPDIGQRVQARFGQLTFKCEPIGPEVAVVVVTVPPQLRLD